MWAALAIVCALPFAYAAGYAWSAPNTDTADELWHAYEIRHALAFPSRARFSDRPSTWGRRGSTWSRCRSDSMSDWLWVAVFMASCAR